MLRVGCRCLRNNSTGCLMIVVYCLVLAVVCSLRFLSVARNYCLLLVVCDLPLSVVCYLLMRCAYRGLLCLICCVLVVGCCLLLSAVGC